MAMPATMSSNWPYPPTASSNTNTNGNMNGIALPNGHQSASLLSAGSKVRSPPSSHGSQALAGTGLSMSPPGTAASTASSNNTGSGAGGGPASLSSSTSPSRADLGNTLHSFSSLSLNSGSTAASSNSISNNYNNAKSPVDFTRPLPLRTPSGGSLQHYQQQQITPQISAIGSGRSGTSPPSRSGNLDSLNEGSSIVGSPSSNSNALSPRASLSQQLPPPQRDERQQIHTPSHNLPWPAYANNNSNGETGGSLSFLNSAPQSQIPNFGNRAYNYQNSIDANNQSSHFNSNFHQQEQQYHQQQRQQTDIDHRNRNRHPQQQPRLQEPQQQYQAYQYSQDQDLPESNNINRTDSGDNRKQDDSSSSSSSRFAQPQFNLDHAQLAKSREQKDLDDIDSGHRASATLWMGDLEGWMDETYIKKCITALGWDREMLSDSSSPSESTPGQTNGTSNVVQTSVKMIKGASSTSGYCFITFPTSPHAQAVLAHFSKQPPMLMPGSERTFKREPPAVR